MFGRRRTALFQNKRIVTVAVFNFSVCGARLVAAIRSALVKGRSSGDAVWTATEEMAKELKERISQLHQIQKQTVNGSGTWISPARVMYKPPTWLLRSHMLLQKLLYLLSSMQADSGASEVVLFFLSSQKRTLSITPLHTAVGTQ